MLHTVVELHVRETHKGGGGHNDAGLHRVGYVHVLCKTYTSHSVM